MTYNVFGGTLNLTLSIYVNSLYVTDVVLIIQEDCARVLMFRGANKELRNSTGHTPYEIAIAASYHGLADTIQKFRPEDVGEKLSLTCGLVVVCSSVITVMISK